MIECEPTVSDEVERVAAPPEIVPEPSVAAPSRKFTLPVGTPELELIVAVNVTELSETAGLLLVAKAREVDALAVGCATVSE